MKPINRRTLGMGAAALLIAMATPARSSNLDDAARILERQARAGRGEFITYLVGAAAAYRWASVDDDAETPPLYCPAPDLKLDGRAWARIALDEYKRNRSKYADLKEYPLSVFALALLHGLQSNYPCSSDDAEPSPAAGE